MEATKKLTKKETWIRSFEQKTNAIKTTYKNIVIINYVNNGKPIVAIWETKSHKPTYHYRFNTADEMFHFITERQKKADEYAKIDAQRMSDYTEEKKGYVEGAILFSSWGWEQTNIDWYIVLERKNDFVIIQEIGSKRTYDRNFNDRGDCIPDATIRIGEPFRKKITKYASINLESYKYCALWDGKPKSWSSYA